MSLTTQILQIVMDAVICILLIVDIERNRDDHRFLITMGAVQAGAIDAKIVQHTDDDGFDIVSTKGE